MPAAIPKRKRTAEHLHKAKKTKRFKKQKNYHSSSDSDEDDEDDAPDFAPIAMDESDDDIETTAIAPVSTSDTAVGTIKQSEDAGSAADSDDNDEDVSKEDDEPELDDDIEIDDESLGEVDSDLGDASNSDEDSQVGNKKRKRNDPSAFATSMSKILSSKLTVSKRADPVLARSAAASTAQKEMTESRLETKAKQKLRADRIAALERGRIKDVLGLETEGVSAAEVQERERRLKKTAQRGVVKLFNAVRAAQVQADVAREQARKEGVVGMAQREQRINEMSKQGFLDLISKGGKKKATIEEG
ncbi:hypothetical protein ANO11243_019510 [Dothideomycetidae sp. 11243]|nr:hypothetical protein ANO11243_019510 [fungal sp. No.11243]